MVDYAIQPNDDMIRFYNWLKDKNIELYWIDHHATAIQNLEHLGIPGYRTMKHSGCYNTYEFLNKHLSKEYENFEELVIPEVVLYINDFDIWNRSSKFSWNDKILPMSNFIASLGVNLNDNNDELVVILNKLFNGEYLDKAIEIGKYITKYVFEQYEKNEKHIFRTKWLDYDCLVINSSTPGSLQFEKHPDYSDVDMCITFSYDGSTQAYQYGLYTTDRRINVGELAATYLSGGGHQAAAGGRSKELIFDL